jgi:hypothetical protein
MRAAWYLSLAGKDVLDLGYGGRTFEAFMLAKLGPLGVPLSGPASSFFTACWPMIVRVYYSPVQPYGIQARAYAFNPSWAGRILVKPGNWT